MKNRLAKAYRRSFFGERTLLSRAVDTSAFCLLLFAAAFLVSLSIVRKVTAALLTAPIFTLLGGAISDAVVKARLERHIARLREQFRHDIERRKLLLLDIRALRPVIESSLGCPVWFDQSAGSVEPDTVYSAARYMLRRSLNRCVIVSISTLSEEAAKCLEALDGFNIEHRTAGELSELAEYISVSEEEIDAAILQKYGVRRKRRPAPSLAMAPDRIKKYFVMGLLLYLLSFVMTYGLYMRIVASLAFGAAGALFVREEIRLQSEKRRA